MIDMFRDNSKLNDEVARVKWWVCRDDLHSQKAAGPDRTRTLYPSRAFVDESMRHPQPFEQKRLHLARVVTECTGQRLHRINWAISSVLAVL